MNHSLEPNRDKSQPGSEHSECFGKCQTSRQEPLLTTSHCAAWCCKRPRQAAGNSDPRDSCYEGERVGTKGPVEGENQDLGRERYCSADPALGTGTHVISARGDSLGRYTRKASWSASVSVGHAPLRHRPGLRSSLGATVGQPVSLYAERQLCACTPWAKDQWWGGRNY